MLEIRHVETTQAAYNEIYREDGILLRDSFYLWLIDLLKPVPGKRLVDISCGEGRLVTFAQAQGLDAIGIDFAKDGVLKGIRATPEAGWSVGDGELLPFASSSADYITHIGSLEHYHNPQDGIREITRILKPDGRACILLPNAFGLFGNIKHVMETGDIFDDGQPLQRYNTRNGWRDMLLAGGLKPYDTLRYEREWPRTASDALWYATHPPKLIRLLIARFVPLNLSNCLVYLCTK